MKTEQDCFATQSIRCPHCYRYFTMDDISNVECLLSCGDIKFLMTCPICGEKFYCYNVLEPMFATTRVVGSKEILEWQD